MSLGKGGLSGPPPTICFLNTRPPMSVPSAHTGLLTQNRNALGPWELGKSGSGLDPRRGQLLWGKGPELGQKAAETLLSGEVGSTLSNRGQGNTGTGPHS